MTSERTVGFPDDFVWGAAAASYQIEGASEADGKGPSVWDMFCERPGAVFEGHSGRTAVDHYHRYPEDVALMRELGLGAYRLSLSWSRLFPEGKGRINEAGFDFYDRLLDSLLAAGITPWVTLFHWDYPLALFEQGGWLNRDSADWFAEYAAAVARRFSDRVTHFFTQNEPQVYLGLGHQQGEHAPGLTLPLSQVLLAGHHSLLAHGKAVQALRANARQRLQLGYAPVGLPKLPVSDDPAHLELARRATFTITERNVWNNTWWMDPVYLGRYPEQGLEFYGKDAPQVQPEDLAVIHQPLDFFATNIYQGQTVRPASQGPWEFELVQPGVGHAATAFNWPVTPQALYYGPKFFFERYGLPIVISENGLSSRDWVGLDGRVHDGARIDFTHRYLLELERAIRDGVPTQGYFHWSILDNFEWAAGYRERFGLIHVDYETQRRTPKDSFAWYARVIRSKGRALHER
ncbi:MAG TPA: GH1 family beta-glucosidase [Polyangiaceae bacterium]|nr:GH1 family beta-glucosidase [Polyangiaceae bacterium]